MPQPMRFSGIINPHPCNQAAESQNWRGLNNFFQWLDNHFDVTYNEETNEWETNLVNINEIDVTEITVEDVTVNNNLTSNTINVTEVYATEINSSYVTTYNITYQVIYDSNGDEKCPADCDASGSGGGSSSSSCTNCTNVDALPATIYLDVEWPIGTTPVTVTLTRTSQHLSTSGGGYCQSKYSGSGAFGTGNGTAQFKVWVYWSCTPGQDLEIRYTHDFCSGGSFMSSDSDRTTWQLCGQSTDDDSPLYGEAIDGGVAGELALCGSHFSNANITVYE